MKISACQPGISQKITGRKIRRILLVGMIFISICLLFSERAPLNAAVASPADGWTRLSDPIAAGGVIYHLVAAPSDPDILYALQEGEYSNPLSHRLVRSQDGGATWQMILLENHFFESLAVDPGNPNILYATDLNQLLKSNDAGLNWAILYPFGGMVVAPAPGRVYVTGMILGDQDYYIPAFARSLDWGATWEVSLWETGDILDFLYVSPTNPDLIIATTQENNIHWWGESKYSLDGGMTWQMLLVNGNSPPIYDLTFDPEDPARIYLTGANMWTTDDIGDTWSQCGPIPKTFPLKLLAVGDRVYTIPSYYPHTFIDPIWFVYHSEDHCATWSKSSGGLPVWVNSLIGDARSPGRLLATTSGYGFIISTNGGEDWTESNTGLTSPAKVSKLAVAPSDPNVILAGSRDPRPGVYRSSDGGVTWSPALSDIEPLSMLIHPLDPLKAWIGTKDGIYYTEDSLHWSLNPFSGMIYDLASSQASRILSYAAYEEEGKGYVLRFQNHWQAFPVDRLNGCPDPGG